MSVEIKINGTPFEIVSYDFRRFDSYNEIRLFISGKEKELLFLLKEYISVQYRFSLEIPGETFYAGKCFISDFPAVLEGKESPVYPYSMFAFDFDCYGAEDVEDDDQDEDTDWCPDAFFPGIYEGEG